MTDIIALNKQMDTMNRHLSNISNVISNLYNILNVTNNPVYKTLLTYLVPKSVNGYKYVRLGKNNDGGYVIVGDFSDITNAISLGINNDVSFDLDLAARKITVYQFDPTIDRTPIDNSLFKFYKIGVKGSSIFHPINSSYDYLTLDEIQKKFLSNDVNILLKMDIEGYEYEALLDENLSFDRFKHIVLEIHHLLDPLHACLFLKILRKLCKTHQLIYIHPNNWSPFVVVNNQCICNVYELSFVRQDNYVFVDYDVSANNLGMPNNTKKNDIFLVH